MLLLYYIICRTSYCSIDEVYTGDSVMALAVRAAEQKLQNEVGEKHEIRRRQSNTHTYTFKITNTQLRLTHRWIG